MLLINQFNDSNNTIIFVGGLSGYAAGDELWSSFQGFGEIIYARILLGKGCGFVQFVYRSAAEIVMNQMHGYVIGNSRVHLSWGNRRPSQAYELRTAQPLNPSEYIVTKAPEKQPRRHRAGGERRRSREPREFSPTRDSYAKICNVLPVCDFKSKKEGPMAKIFTLAHIVHESIITFNVRLIYKLSL
jgi:RNA recognition motif-containing protein